MFDVDSVPYFPIKLTPLGEDWLMRNPVIGSEHELNREAFHLVRLCDGYRTWGEIAVALQRAHHATLAQVMALSEPLLEVLTTDGLLWWRRQRMHWWRLPPPGAVLWDLTSGCNLSCRHCVVSGGDPGKGELDLEACRRLAEELAAFGVQQLILSGGEPLTRSDFFEIAEHAAAQGLRLQVATNATLINRTKAQRLAAIGADAQVSLDGATPETHEGFRGVGGSWKRTVEGIHFLVSAGVPVMLAVTVTKTNIHEIPALYELARSLGAHTFRILPFVPFGRGAAARNLEVAPEAMRHATAYLCQHRDQGGLPIAPMEFECTLSQPPSGSADPQARIGCDGAVGYCTITSDGEVLPCNFFAGVDAENVKEHSFAWIWENSHFLNYFRSLTVSDIGGACQSCAWLPVCRGSCIAANFTRGNLFQANCHCWLVNGPPPAGPSSMSRQEIRRGHADSP